MFLSTMQIVILALGFLALAGWLFFFFKGNQYASLFETLPEKEYPLKEIYGVGYAVMETLRYKYKSKKDRKLRQEIDILYGHKYAEFYLRVIYAQKVTLAFTVFVISFIVYGLVGDVAVLLVMWMFAGLAYYYYGTLTKKRILARSDELLRDFAEVISKLALLTNAGMILHEAWEEVAYAGNSVLYQEMQKSVEDMRNGTSELDAYHAFGMRCIIPEIKKFTSTIMQGVTKGNRELSSMLQHQSKEVWEAKQQHTRRQGEKAASKLLIPICIMFVGILVMVLVPIFANLGVA